MATAAFLREARRADAPLIALVKIYLASPTAKTLYLSSNFIETPNFQLWEGAIVDFDSISAPGTFLATGPDPCKAGFSLATRSSLGSQVVETANLSALFKDYRWIGAKVEIYMWSQRLTSFADAWLAFSGIVQSYKVSSATIDVRCIQRQDYDKIVSPVFVDRDKFPRSPERSVGLPLPIVYGAIKGPKFRSPWADPYGTHQNAIEDCHGGQLGIPGVVVDTGRGGVNQKMEVRFAGHALKSHGVTADSTQYFIQAEDRIGSITPSELFSGSAGAGFRLGDEFDAAIFPVRFVEQSAWSANPCDNAPYGMDVFDEASFARFRAQGAPGGFVQGRKFRAEAPAPKGVLVEAFLRMAYSTGPSGLSSFHVATLKNGGGGSGILSPPPNSSTPTTVRQSLGTAWGGVKLPNDPWNFSEIEVTFEWLSVPAPGISEEFRLYFIGIEVVYKPEAKTHAQGYTIPAKLRRGGGRDWGRGPVGILEPSVVVPPDTEIESEFFGTVEGMADDGSGAYTGVALALIERPCDIAHHLLRNYGGQAAGQVEAGAGVFGSFVDARTSLKTWKKGTYKSALVIAESSDVGTQLRRLAEAGLGWCYIDRFSDKWLWVPWLRDAGTDYARRVWRDDIIAFEIDSIPSGRVPSGIRIPYAWDAATKRYLFASHVSAVSSRAGQGFFDVRDEYLTVVSGVNDRFELDASAVKYAKTFAAGSYTDETFVPVLQSINDVVGPTSVAFGGRIVTDKNDRIHFDDGVPRTGQIAAGLYDMEGLAVAATTAMNAVSTLWTVSYSRATGKFTISRSSGTATLTFGSATGAAAALGFTNESHAAGSPYVGDFAVEENRIAISTSFNFYIEFATGPNGTEAATPKSCADLLGFDGRQDTLNRKWQMAHSPKGWREATLATSAAIYGQTREVVVEGRAIYDTDTARELRNRLVDWLSAPRIVVRFSTTRMPDVHRGELVRFDDLDNFGISFPKAGSGGLWAGRRFRVLQVQQRLGPSFDQEIECIENGTSPEIIDDAMLDFYGGDAVIPAE